MTIEGFLGAIVIGLVLGVLGRIVAPGKQDIPIWLTALVGVAAAILGTLVVGPLRDSDGLDWTELVTQVILAAVGVTVAASAYGRKRKGSDRI